MARTAPFGSALAKPCVLPRDRMPPSKVRAAEREARLGERRESKPERPCEPVEFLEGALVKSVVRVEKRDEGAGIDEDPLLRRALGAVRTDGPTRER